LSLTSTFNQRIETLNQYIDIWNINYFLFLDLVYFNGLLLIIY